VLGEHKPLLSQPLLGLWDSTLEMKPGQIQDKERDGNIQFIFSTEIITHRHWKVQMDWSKDSCL
jgi:hypothetical protein